MRRGAPSLLDKAREAARVAGPWRFFTSVLWWPICCHYLVLVRELEPPLPRPPLVPGFRGTALAEGDVPWLPSLNPETSLAEIDRRRRAGERAALAWVDDALIGYRWETAGPRVVDFLGKTIHPEPGDMIGSGMFVHPAFRGRGIAAALAAWQFDRARERGFRRAVVLVAALNTPSLRAFAKLGCRPVGGLTVWQAGSRRAVRAAGAAAVEGECVRVARCAA
jgi:GNAT superfamily N-acetyltransferase